jgi:hypothetical protein
VWSEYVSIKLQAPKYLHTITQLPTHIAITMLAINIVLHFTSFHIEGATTASALQYAAQCNDHAKHTLQ